MICATIKAITTAQAISQIQKISRDADCIEVRVDHIRNPDIKNIIKSSKKPIIITNRSKKEHGAFRGSEKKRIGILEKAIDENADFVDIEFSSKKINELIKYKNRIKNKRTKVICSFHNFEKTDRNEIFIIYKKIKKLKPDIIKIVTLANDINDNLMMYSLLKKAKKENIKCIAFCMGELGISSRILCLKFGSLLTFASADAKKETAPGQLGCFTMRNIYHCNRINSKTKIFGLAGNPVDKSLGYIIHNKLFEKRNAVYVNFFVDNFKEFLEHYKNIIDGLSITMPFKDSAFELVDKIEKNAKNIGSINTIIKKNNKLVGYNTDYLGAVAAIQENTKIKNKKFLIIGTGGIAKAIVYGIIKKKGIVTIAGRNERKCKTLSKKFHCNYILLKKIKNLDGFDIIINATPVGMLPNINKTIINSRLLNKKHIVMDSIYNSKLTKLLKEARKKICKIIPGCKLFLYQALEQQRLFGNKPDNIKNIESLLLNNLK